LVPSGIYARTGVVVLVNAVLVGTEP
jgi:hypothetical protein